MKTPYLIFETASFHGGDPTTLDDLLKQLVDVSYNGRRGIKFHTIGAETLAKSNFSAFDVYQELQILPEDWSKLIGTTAAHMDVWLEMADLNCVNILRSNRSKVYGIKFQASMLENREVLDILPHCKPETLQVLINASGLEISEIEECINRLITTGLAPDNLILQIGFQGYPTAASDTMLNKLSVLQNAFPALKLSMADHMKADDPFAKVIPAIALSHGCTHIEKHVALDRTTAKYDHYSALEPIEAQELAVLLEQTSSAFSTNFISAAEARYLQGSILQPCLAYDMPKGSLIGLDDLIFRRQGEQVLSSKAIFDIQARGHVLANDMKAMDGLTTDAYRQAKISAIVACRMKSTRLKRKPLLEITGKAALHRCLENCLLFPRVETVVLATSTHPDDAVLETMTLDGRVEFYRGDPEDVLLRYLGVAEQENIDIIVRVTSDNPVVSPEITEYLIDSHLKKGADFTRATVDAVGTGTHIISVSAMRKVIQLLGGSPMSEYMNWYFENNPDVFKLNIVDLPQELVRDYRLTLDYQADLDMFEALFSKLESEGKTALTANVFAVLDQHPDIVSMNDSQAIVYQTDTVLIEKLKRDTRIDK